MSDAGSATVRERETVDGEDPLRGASVRWPGRPRPTALLRDGVAAAIAQPVATVTAALVVAIVCVVVLVTTGQSAAAERAVMQHIDSVGTRLVVAFDQTGDARIHADGIHTINTLDTVSWAFALGPVTDVRNADSPRTTGIALRPLFGDLPPTLTITTGRAPAEGEAIVGAEAAKTLGLRDGVGTVSDGTHSWPVVGVFTAPEPLASLTTTAILPTSTTALTPGGEPVLARFVYAMATDVTSVDTLAKALPSALPAASSSGITVETPSGALELRRVVAGELGASSRQLMAVVLTVGLALITVTVFGAVASRRRDFGRRRALGATRNALMVLVLVQTAIAASLGVAVGTATGLLTVFRMSGELPAQTFTMGVATLALLIAVIGAMPPAMAAARRDPVSILRVP